MQLIQSPASPFARKVRVVIHELGLSDRVTSVPVTTTALDSDASLVAANPLGKLPALTRDDGPAIADSRVITRYLDSVAGGKLYPQTRLWATLTLEATADGIMDAAVLMVYEHKLRPPEKVFENWVEAQWQKVHRAVTAVDDRWMSHLSGPLDASHIAVGCALGYLDFRHPTRNWRAGNGALDDWYAAFAERPSMKATDPI